MCRLRTPTPTGDRRRADLFIRPSRRRSYGLATVLPTIALALAPIAAPPAEAAFGFRKLLTIDNTRVSGTADHPDFPVLVSLPNDPDLQVGVQSPNGWDIEFRANDGLTRLDHEIELYDAGTGTLVAWVRIPTLSYNSDTLFYIYYGDAGVQCPLENPAGVWDADYVGVWHLDETGAGVAGEFADSTSNSNDGQGGGVPARATAQIAGGQDFDGANDYITVPSSTSLQPTAALTLQAWVYVRTFGAGFDVEPFLRKGQVNPHNYQLSAEQQAINFDLDEEDGAPLPGLSGSLLSPNTWYFVVGAWDGTTRTIYVDGTPDASGAKAAPIGSDARPLLLGGRPDLAEDMLDGLIDEARVSRIARSADWIQTEYRNQFEPSKGDPCTTTPNGFLCAGAEQILPAPWTDVSLASGLNTPIGGKDGGLSWGDFDDDGCLDILVNGSSVARSDLYRQDTAASVCLGTFTDVTACLAPGLDVAQAERSALWADFNNDGYLDLARNSSGLLEVYLNNGPGVLCGINWSVFGVAGSPNVSFNPGNVEGMGVIDYDNDGDLDLVTEDDVGASFQVHANDGTGIFTNPETFGFGIDATGDYLAVADHDVDGDVDVLGRSDGTAIDLWANVGGAFVAGAFNETADPVNKGGVAFCDLDDDGDFDIVWTDFGTNQVWRNNGGTDAAVTWTAMGALPTAGDIDGVACGDVDNDGDLDLMMTSNGNDHLLRNDGAFAFVDISPASFGVTNGEGTAFGDYDRDGDLDLVINQAIADNELWRNNTDDLDYLMVRALHDVDGTPGGTTRDAIGATVVLRDCGGTRLSGVREVNGGRGHGSQDPALVHFGLCRGCTLSGPDEPYVVSVSFVGGPTVNKAVVPSGLGTYQEVSITSTDTEDLGACNLTAVELVSFEARALDSAVDLEWRTGSELDNLGFHLYRSLSKTGPWTRITAALIPGLGSSPEGASYSFPDTGLTNGVRYFYRLEDIDAHSGSTFHGPVSAVPGAVPPSDENDPGDTDSSEGSDASAPEGSPDTEPASKTYGRPEGASLRIVSRSRRAMVVELRTPGFVATETPCGFSVSVPGFDQRTDARAPDLPLKRVVLDGLVGRQARIIWVKERRIRSFPGLTPAAVGDPAIVASPDGTVRPRRRRASLPDEGLLPRVAARIPGDAFIGKSKKLALEMSPLRYDTTTGQLRLARRLRVKIAFDRKAARKETGSGSRGRRRPRFLRRATPGVLAHLHTQSQGLYAVSFETLFPQGRQSVPLDSLRLSLQGESVAFHVTPRTRPFGPGSILYFYAATEAASTDYSSEVAFALERAAGGLRMPLVSAAPRGQKPLSSAPLAETSFETNRFFQAGLLHAPDIWLWDFIVSRTSKSFPLTLEGLDFTSPAPAHLRVLLQGASEADTEGEHHLSVSLNGTPLGETSFDGKLPHVFSTSVSASVLLEGENTLTVTNLGDTGGYSFVFLDRVDLIYPQSAALRSGLFGGVFSEAGEVVLSGEVSVGLDVTDPDSPVWLQGLRTKAGTVSFGAEASHRYALASPEALLVPRVSLPAPSTLRSPENQADYVVIAPEAFLEAVQPLAERRRDQGLGVKAVSFEEIASVFGHGRPSAEAIRDFLAYAYHSWSEPSLRYVLLLGDSSYDPRNFTGNDQGSPLPAMWAKTSYLWTVSDPALVAINGEDLLPDVAVGRLPAKTLEQARVLVQKVLAWEGVQDLSGPAVLVADNPDRAGDFEADVLDIHSSFLGGRETKTLFLRQLGGGTRPQILASFDEGASLMSYVGHGGAAVWASENVLNSWDVGSLRAQSRQPLMLTFNCLNGYFLAPNYEALGEAFLKAEGRGTIGAFSPSGLSLDAPAHRFHRALMAQITGGDHERLGDAVLAAQAAYAEEGLMPELLAIYHLLADPGMRIR